MIYRVTADLTLYVEALNETEAIKEAEEAVNSGEASYELSEAGIWLADKVTSGSKIPQEYMDSIPWGSPDDRTIRQKLNG